jgi:hypothetical protein
MVGLIQQPPRRPEFHATQDPHQRRIIGRLLFLAPVLNACLLRARMGTGRLAMLPALPCRPALDQMTLHMRANQRDASA